MNPSDVDTSQVLIVRNGKIEKARLVSTHFHPEGVWWALVAVLSDGKFQTVMASELRLAASVLPGPKPE